MKNAAALALAAVLLLSAVSCGGGGDTAAATTPEVTTAPPETTVVTETTPAETEPPVVVEIPQETRDDVMSKLKYYKETGAPDLYGWIIIDGTDIDYPLVQSADNDFYLNHSEFGEWREIGSIFVDYRNRKNVEDPYNYNIVMYGHNLTWGGMFHDVQTMFENEQIFRDAYIYIYTFDGIYVYEPFAVYEANAYYQYFRTHFDYPHEFVDFANEMKGNSIYAEDVEFYGDDRMITLSTCTNTYVDGRYALQAKLVQVTRWE